MNKLLLSLMVLSSISFAQVTPELCQIAYNNVVSGEFIPKTQGSGFYNKASIYARSHNVCVKAEMFASSEGVRVYLADGSRVGGKNGSQYSNLSQSASYNCVVMTCIALADSKAQTGTGYGAAPVQPGAIVVTPSIPSYPTVQVGGGY